MNRSSLTLPRPNLGQVQLNFKHGFTFYWTCQCFDVICLEASTDRAIACMSFVWNTRTLTNVLIAIIDIKDVVGNIFCGTDFMVQQCAQITPEYLLQACVTLIPLSHIGESPGWVTEFRYLDAL